MIKIVDTSFNVYNATFFFKKIRKMPGDTIILHMCTKILDMTYSSWDINHGRLKLVILGHFLPFYHPKNKKNQNFEKIKNMAEIIAEIDFWNCLDCWNFTHVHPKSQSYDVQFLKYRLRQTEFLFILGLSLPFYPTNNLQNQNFEKVKKAHGDIIGLN